MANNIILSSHLNLSLSYLGHWEYFEALVSRGFDTWDNLTDISEETMAELDVRLGHRRKLQREIASYRGQPRSQSLFSPPAVDGGLQDSEGEPKSPHAGQDELETKTEPTQLKRRYRHRQRKDPHAPRRPSCDYVLFGNFLRQQPDVAQLSFVEISKLVGERWQRLSLEERAMWTSTAAEQKSRYITELAEYRQSKEYQHHQDNMHITKTKQGKRALTGELSPTVSSETVSSRPNSKNSSITVAASDNGRHSASTGKRFMVFSFESSSPALQVAEKAEILCLAQSYKDYQLTPSLYEAPRQESTDRSQTAMPPQCYTNFAVDSFKLKGGGIPLHTQAGAEKVRSFHIQVLNPFRMIPGMAIWDMLESYLQHVNSLYYCVNPKLLVQQFHLAMDTATNLPNHVMYTLCLCVSIGCQTHDTGTDEMAIMWYENGRRYLDDDDWGWNLNVMRALALISIFHRSARPSTARHYLDIALRIGEANSLSAYVNDASTIEWVLVWGTIQRMASIGFAYPVTS